MTFFVHWCLATDDGRVIENGRFDGGFASRADAVLFVLGQLERAPRYGFSAALGHWWFGGDRDAETQTRLWIDADATISAQQTTAGYA